MKFSVGYQLRQTFDWIDAILARREHVAEVYFAWPGFANGRSDSAAAVGFTPWEAQTRIEQNLSRVADADIASLTGCPTPVELGEVKIQSRIALRATVCVEMRADASFMKAAI